MDSQEVGTFSNQNLFSKAIIKKNIIIKEITFSSSVFTMSLKRQSEICGYIFQLFACRSILFRIDILRIKTNFDLY